MLIESIEIIEFTIMKYAYRIACVYIYVDYVGMMTIILLIYTFSAGRLNACSPKN